MAGPRMPIRPPSPSISLDEDDNDDDLFFDAAPGIKRPNSNDSMKKQDEAYASSSTSSMKPTHASTSSSQPPSHKRIRTKAPAPPQGVKRSIPSRRVSDHQQNDGPSDSDASFSRRLPPKKRVRSVAPDPVEATGRERNLTRQVSVPAIDDRALVSSRKKMKKRTVQKTYDGVSNTFNFTPSSSAFTTSSSISYDVDALLEQADELRQQANGLYRCGRYFEALQAYTSALAQYPTGAADVPPPLVLLTNRAAAYISLGQWEDALNDMRKSVTYPSDDIEGNVKRFNRYAKCLIVLGKLVGEEVEQVEIHMKSQLGYLESDLAAKKDATTAKVLSEGRRTLADLTKARELVSSLNAHRSAGQYNKVVEELELLFAIYNSQSKKEPPDELQFMYLEALYWEDQMSTISSNKSEQLNFTLDSSLAKLNKNDAAYYWLISLIHYSKAELDEVILNLDLLRMKIELPSQASRLLHRSYTLKNLIGQIEGHIQAGKWMKVLPCVKEINRLVKSKEGPRSSELERHAEVYKCKAEVELGKYESTLSYLDSYERYPSNPIMELQARCNLVKALKSTNNPKEAKSECEKALEFASTISKLNIKDRSLIELLKEVLNELKAMEKMNQRKLASLSPYEILSISTSPTEAEIKKAYKKESLKYHPDKPSGDAERFKLISEAYQKLMASVQQSRRSSYGRYGR